MIKIEGVARVQVSSPNATVLMGCELSMRITRELLNNCLGKICAAHPLLTMPVEISANNEAILVPSKTNEFFFLEYENSSYGAIVTDHIKEEWALGKSFIKFIINQIDDHSQIIVCCNHAICDGLSLVHLLEDMAAYLVEGVIPDEEKVTLLHPKTLQQKQGAWPYKIMARLMAYQWKKHQIQLTQEMLSEIHNAYWNTNKVALKSLSLGTEETQNIIRNAKMHGVSVNTYLTAVLYKSQQVLPNRPYTNNCIISVNLRDKMSPHPGRQLGYFVTAIGLRFSKLSTDSSKWLTRLQHKINRKLNSKSLFRSLALYFFDPTFFDLIQLNKFHIRNDRSLQNIVKKQSVGIKKAFALTNLGILRVNKSSEHAITQFLPLVLASDSFEKYISVFTYKGKMTLALCYDPSKIPTEDIDRYALKVKQLLLNDSI